MIRLGAPAMLLAAGLGMCGCEREASSVPAGTPVAAAANSDWRQAKPSDGTASMAVMCGVCRLLDVRYKGEKSTVTVTFNGAGVQDDAGQTMAMSASDWNGMLALIAASKSGKGFARAVPAEMMDYRDGFGKARRHAYEIVRKDESTLVFTIIKKLDDDSRG